MSANTDPIFALSANLGEVDFVNADGTTAETVFTAGENGSVLKAMSAHTDDSSDAIVDVFINDGSSDYAIGSVPVPDLSGSDGGTNPGVNLYDTTNIPALPSDGLFLPSGYSVKVAPQSAVTADKTLTIIAIGFDY